MMKIFKKAFAVILCAAIMLTIAIPAFAAKKESSDTTPVIIVPGVINTPLIDEDGTSVLMPDFTSSSMDYESIIKALKAVLKLQDSNDYAGATQKLLKVLHNVLDKSMCNADGTSTYNLHINYNLNSYATDASVNESLGKTIGHKIGMKNVYVFNYDWRMDMVGIVDDGLAPFVERVKQQTGSDKVILVGLSMGGGVTNTYLTNYAKRNDVKKAIFVSGAGQGVQLVSDILCGDIVAVREGFAQYFNGFTNTGVAIGVSAISNYACQIINKLIDSQLQTIWDEFLSPFFLHYPAVWEFAEHNAKIEKAMTDNNINPVLKAKVEKYYKIQENIDTTLTAAQQNGTEICYVSGYNLVGVPFTSSAMKCSTDFLIDTHHTSNGATVSNLFSTLGDNYKQKKDDGHNHLSADGMIDASTCFTPEKTWFIKGLMHVDYGEDTAQSKFITWLVTTDNATISTNSKYPQFLDYNKTKKTLTPLTKVVIDETAADSSDYISSAVTTYTYTQLTALGWAVIALIALAVILIIVKSNSGKEQIDGVLSKKEIKALPKAERKGAKKNNKALKKQFKKDKKAQKKARKAELKAMPKKERKAAKKADKAQKKANKKEMKLNKKASKAEKKAAKKNAKAEKKANKNGKADSQENAEIK